MVLEIYQATSGTHTVGSTALLKPHVHNSVIALTTLSSGTMPRRGSCSK